MGRRYFDWEITDSNSWKAPLVFVVAIIVLIVGILFLIGELIG
jgi:hypothetical protein